MPIPVIKVIGPHSFGTYEPGNGASYTAVAIPWIGPNQSVGVIGEVDEGWLVVAGNGRAHLFQSKGFLTDDYVEEKLGGGCWWQEDIPHLALLVRTLLGRPALQKVICDYCSHSEGVHEDRGACGITLCFCPTFQRPEPPHRDLDTIDLEHDQGLRDLRDPFEPRSF